MGRSGAKCTTDADLAAGLFAPAREDRFEADAGAGGRPHGQGPAGRSGRVAASGRQNAEPSSGNSQCGLAGLSSPDAAGLVQPATKGFEHAAAASTDRAGTARRTPHRRDSAWRDGNAYAGADIGRESTPVRYLFQPQEAQPNAGVELLW